MKYIKVGLGDHSYRIVVGGGLLERAGSLLSENGFARQPVIITNPVVRGLYGPVLEPGLVRAGFQPAVLEVPDGEAYKSLETAARLYRELTDLRAERATPILALGGGVIGDLAGFVAATYLRGVPLIQLPTTLLAQVDSSIGGKVAVDYGQLKNRIGAFYQPRLVITDTATLQTLPPPLLADGLAEVIKSAVIRDKELFGYLEKHLAAILALEEERLEEVVFRTARIKAAVVAADEKESGLRAILNYGHTVGHALETVSDFGLSHGAAVAIGMVVAAALAQRMGLLKAEVVTRLEKLVRGAGLPIRIPGLDPERIIKAVGYDKKVMQGRARFILPRDIGEVFISDEVSLPLLKEVLVSYNEKA